MSLVAKHSTRPRRRQKVRLSDLLINLNRITVLSLAEADLLWCTLACFRIIHMPPNAEA